MTIPRTGMPAAVARTIRSELELKFHARKDIDDVQHVFARTFREATADQFRKL
ncbi:MAG: hypothetical protein ACXVB2_20370 [Isosphaeraceae bacterium]